MLRYLPFSISHIFFELQPMLYYWLRIMILETKNLSKSFGQRKAVDGLNLEIHEGSVYGFLGLNGSGKSTTIRTMTALILPDEGEVFIQGNSV